MMGENNVKKLGTNIIWIILKKKNLKRKKLIVANCKKKLKLK